MGDDGKGLSRIIKEKRASTIRDGWAKRSPWRMTIPPGASSSSLNGDRPEQEKKDPRKKPFQAFLSHVLRETGRLNNGKPAGTCAIVTEITQILSVRQAMVKWSAEQPDGHTYTHACVHAHTHNSKMMSFCSSSKNVLDFPDGKVDGYLPTNAGDMGLISGPGRSPRFQEVPPGSRKILFCVPQLLNLNSRAHVLQLPKPTFLGHALSSEKPAHQN